MALKADRYEESTDISYFYNAAEATRGGVVCLADNGLASGAALDQGENLVSYLEAAATNIPIGILLNDVVDKDLTRQHINQHKDEVQLGGKVTVLTRGWVMTDKITGTAIAGSGAYADSTTAGNISSHMPLGTAQASGNLCIGRWGSRMDDDLYAKLYVNLPGHGGGNL